MASDVAASSAQQQNEAWRLFGREVALAKNGVVLEARRIEYVRHTCMVTKSAMIVPVASAVTAERKHLADVNVYRSVLHAIEFTNEVVVTAKQRKALEQLFAGQDVTYQLWWSVRRRDTGATALVLRNGNDWMTLYEDGTHSGNLWIRDIRIQQYAAKVKTSCPDFNGSWFYDKRATHTWKPEPTALKANKATGQICIR
jgi:hypothetical protein